MKWFEDIGETFGIMMNGHRAATWLEIVDESIPGISEQELSEVAKFIRQQPDLNKSRRPSATNMISWIKWYRKTEAANRHGWGRGTDEGSIDAVWQGMTRAPDHESRWNLLVEGGDPLPPDAGGHYQYRKEWTDEHRKELDYRAARRWPDWNQATNEIKSGFNRAQVAMLVELSGKATILDVDDAPF